jgi:hypothetical protein
MSADKASGGVSVLFAMNDPLVHGRSIAKALLSLRHQRPLRSRLAGELGPEEAKEFRDTGK